MFKTAFLEKNVNNNSKPQHRFFSNFGKYALELFSFISASLKSIVTEELAAQIVGQI